MTFSGGEVQTQCDKIVLDLHPSRLILCASSINTWIPILLHKHLNQWILQSPNSWRDIALGYNPTWLETTAFKCLFPEGIKWKRLDYFIMKKMGLKRRDKAWECIHGLKFRGYSPVSGLCDASWSLSLSSKGKGIRSFLVITPTTRFCGSTTVRWRSPRVRKMI